jgi:hypothetical protein
VLGQPLPRLSGEPDPAAAVRCLLDLIIDGDLARPGPDDMACLCRALLRLDGRTLDLEGERGQFIAALAQAILELPEEPPLGIGRSSVT